MEPPKLRHCVRKEWCGQVFPAIRNATQATLVSLDPVTRIALRTRKLATWEPALVLLAITVALARLSPAKIARRSVCVTYQDAAKATRLRVGLARPCAQLALLMLAGKAVKSNHISV